MAASLRRAAVLGLAASAGGASAANPFEGKAFYVNPANQKEFDGSIATATGVVQENLRKMRDVPSAYWIDVKEKIRGNTTGTLAGILQDAAAKSPPELVVVIWYDLPNRDCDAKASNGQICCSKNPDGTCNYDATGDCAEGLKEYASDYVDPFIAVLKEYAEKVPVVVILEPDSLPNLATNSGHPHCGNPATQAAYKQGVKYAMDQLTTQAPSVGVYLDAAHGGWLGWEDNLEKFIALLKDMNLPMNKIRGFSTNVANYQALGQQCPWEPDQGFRNGYCLNGKHASDPCCADPCKLLGQYNPGNGEFNYAQALVRAGNAAFGIDARIVIDTGRNGVGNERTDCANWCNPRGAGAGIASTTKTANALVDAFFWLKTPGESDGCSQTLPDASQCKRYDSMCGSVDSLGTKASEPHAPEAGQWFDFQVKMLAENAQLAPPAPTPTPTPSPTPGPTPTPTPPPSPTPTPSPRPTPTPSPTPTGQCCWGAAGATCAQMSSCQGDFCGASEDQCTKNCSGSWCSKANDEDGVLDIVV